MFQELDIKNIRCGPSKPDWLKIRLSHNRTFQDVRKLMRGRQLHTVCEEAACPNMAECWSRGTATFMIMGDTCSRSCRFCNVKTGKGEPLDPEEPKRVAEAVLAMKLKYAVITSVNRDHLEDGGAAHFAVTIREVHNLNPDCRVEVLIPDFMGSEQDLKTVCDAGPVILGHNTETVARLYLTARPQAKYWRSLQLLGRAKKMGMTTKSGIMVGLGEIRDEVIQLMRDLRDVGCDLMTIGQYMQPTPDHLPVQEYVHPDQFEEYKYISQQLGFKHVESGPLVRSSYHADFQEASTRGTSK